MAVGDSVASYAAICPSGGSATGGDAVRRARSAHDDPETDSVQQHAPGSPFRAGAPAGGGLTPGPPCAGPGRVRGRLLHERYEMGGRDRAHQVEAPVRLVGRDLEAAARVVPLVEGDDACGADVVDLLAGVERREAFCLL